MTVCRPWCDPTAQPLCLTGVLPCGDAVVWFVGDACHGCACLNGDEKGWCWTQCYYLWILQQGDENSLT